MREFNTDEEIMEYIKESIEKIKCIDECRLYKEEQLQFSEEVFKLRNSTEWLIRLNRVIENITYSISKSYEYAKLMQSPMEETTNSRMYSYYLEDSVYRDIVLWDIFRQLLNEYYMCGYSQEQEVSIYKFLKNKNVKNKIGNGNVEEIRSYLNSAEHKEVREKLRNQFTHSIDSTSFYLFHRKTDKGVMEADLSNILPNHPYYNIAVVLSDICKCVEFISKYQQEIEKELIKNIMIVRVGCDTKCKKTYEDITLINIAELREASERIIVPCEEPCEYAIEVEGHMGCKPLSINYCRINEEEDKYRGKIELKMTYEEMEKQFGNNECTQ